MWDGDIWIVAPQDTDTLDTSMQSTYTALQSTDTALQNTDMHACINISRIFAYSPKISRILIGRTVLDLGGKLIARAFLEVSASIPSPYISSHISNRIVYWKSAA